MKTKNFLLTLMATMMLATIPASSTLAGEAADSTAVSQKANGKTATEQQKAVAKQMAQQAAQLGKKGVQLATTAITDPKEAERIADEMDSISNNVERLGDSLESMAEDTTFFYEGEEDDSLVAEAIHDEWASDFEEDFGWIGDSWLAKFVVGTLGITGGLLATILVVGIMLVVIGIFTAPLWILAIIIIVAVRSSRKRSQAAGSATPGTNTAAHVQGTYADNNARGTAAAGTTDAASQAQRNGYIQQPYPDENTETWKSGIMYACIGVGLIIMFITMGMEGLWGIGALVSCIGVAKLVIASTTKKHRTDTPDPSRLEPETQDGQPEATTTSEDYNRNEIV